MLLTTTLIAVKAVVSKLGSDPGREDLKVEPVRAGSGSGLTGADLDLESDGGVLAVATG